MMRIRLLTDLRQEEPLKRHITQRLLDTLSPQEHTLDDWEAKEASITALLDTVCDRHDLALIAQDPADTITGYALLTEHSNTWLGTTEGFLYALDVQRALLESPELSVFLNALREEAVRRHYGLMRGEISEREQSQSLVAHLHAAGWTTSGLIPCRLLAPLSAAERTASTPAGGEIAIRASQPEDYPFLVQLLTEATWAGLSAFERTQVSIDVLSEHLRRDFVAAFREHTGWSLIAETAGNGRCGHATVLLSTHPLLDVPEAELVDVFVIPACRGRSLGHQLTTQALATCRAREIPFVRSSIGMEHVTGEHVQQVRTALEKDGWWINSRMMSLRLI